MRTAVFLLLGTACFGQTAHQQHHPPQSAREYASHLESSDRADWQQPGKVIEALALRPDEVVADIGAGTGYFSRRIAPHVSKVLAVDIEEDLLQQTAESSPGNVETVLATPADPKLSDASVDTIFICNVLHHIHGREEYYEKLAAALRPGGRIVVLEFHKKELPVGPPPSMKLAEDELVAELDAAGFREVKSHDFLPYQYFLEFQRR